MNEKEELDSQAKTERHFPIVFQNEKYNKLLAFQNYPEKKFWFKDVEVTEEQLLKILDNAQFNIS